jgi:N-glycosylase/DNA lyase
MRLRKPPPTENKILCAIDKRLLALFLFWEDISVFNIGIKENKAVISGLDRFSLERSCRCGQAFRWVKEGQGYFGVVRGLRTYAEQNGDSLTLEPCNEEQLPMWIEYFDLCRDYAKVERIFQDDGRLGACLEASRGIRVFNQEPFETLISFIISANNNVGRISASVDAVCRMCGEPERRDGRLYFTFPAPEALASLSLQRLQECGIGYRAPYIKETALAVANGFDLMALKDMERETARRELIKLKGVGPKVADCVLLFSLGFTEAFPMDVWMNRAVRFLFFEGNSPSREEVQTVIKRIGPLAGIAQQYIFYYARENKLGVG